MKRLIVSMLTAGLVHVSGVHAQSEKRPETIEALFARDAYVEVIAATHEKLSTEAADYASLRYMGLSLLAKGEYELAAKALEDAVTAAINGSATARPTLSLPAKGLELMARLTELELSQAQPEQATRRAREALDIYVNAQHPMAARDYLGAARAARHLARDDANLYQTALQIFEIGLTHHPDAIELHIGIGDLLLEKYNSAEAREAFVEALQRDENSADALLALARVERFDDSPDALKLAAKVVELRPGWLDAQLLYAHSAIAGHEFDVAKKAIEDALAINPRSAMAWALRAAIHLLEINDSALTDAIDKIKESEPGDASALTMLVEIAVRNRLYPQAGEFARRAIVRDNKAWRAYGLLGLNQLRVGAMTAGRRNLDRSFAADPFNIWVRNTLELLDRMEDFETVRSENFELVAEKDEADVLASYLLPLAERAFAYYAKRYDYRPPVPIRIEVFSSHEDFSVRTVGLVGVDILGAAFGPVIAMDSPSARPFGAVNWGAVVWHEISHSFHLAISGFRVPRWFTEGLAVLEEHLARPGWGGDMNPAFLRAFRRGELPGASSLETAFQNPATSEQVGHFYFLSYLLLEFIDEQFGPEAIVRMLEGFGAGRDPVDLVTEVTGLDNEALDLALNRHIEKRFGPSITALTPLVDLKDISTEEGANQYEVTIKTAMTALLGDDKETARVAFEKALELLPDYAGPNSAYHQLAKLYAESGEIAKAREMLEKLTAINADDLEAQSQLADLLLAGEDEDAAIEALEKLSLIDPFDGKRHQQLAELYEARQLWRLAARERYSMLNLDPSDKAGAHYELARVLLKAEELDAARGHVLNALEIAPLFDEGLELLLNIRDTMTAEEDK